MSNAQRFNRKQEDLGAKTLPNTITVRSTGASELRFLITSHSRPTLAKSNALCRLLSTSRGT